MIQYVNTNRKKANTWILSSHNFISTSWIEERSRKKSEFISKRELCVYSKDHIVYLKKKISSTFERFTLSLWFVASKHQAIQRVLTPKINDFINNISNSFHYQPINHGEWDSNIVLHYMRISSKLWLHQAWWCHQCSSCICCYPYNYNGTESGRAKGRRFEALKRDETTDALNDSLIDARSDVLSNSADANSL